MEQLTEDHTHVGWLYRTGQITERQARYHPGKHVLQMALGGKHKNLTIQLGSLPVEAGDRFVLCTDGLIDGLWDNTVRKLMVEPPPYAADASPAKRLLEEAISVSGRDNTTVLVVERL
jgi:protein phosphatase